MKILALLPISFFCVATCLSQGSYKSITEYYIVDNSGKKVSPALSYLEDFGSKSFAVYAVGGYKDTVYPYSIIGGKFGIIGRNGTIILPATYDKIDDFGEESVTIFSQGGLYGLISSNGEKIVDAVHVSISSIYSKDGLFYLEPEKYIYEVCNSEGKILATGFSYIYPHAEGFLVTRNGRSGYVNNDFQPIIPLIYQEIQELDGHFLVKDQYNKMTILDANGKQAITESYDEIRQVRNSDYDPDGYVVRSKGHYGYMDNSLQLRIPIKYNNLSEVRLKSGTLLRFEQNTKYGLLNLNGDVILKPKYNEITSAFETHLLVSAGGKMNSYGYIQNNKYGMLDAQGKTVVPIKFSDSRLESDLALFELKGKWCAYNNNLVQLLAPEYSNIEVLWSYDNNYIKYQKGGMFDEYQYKTVGGVCGLMDANGNTILPAVYEDIQLEGYGESGLLKLKKEGVYGLFTMNGIELVKPAYSKIDCNDEVCIAAEYVEKKEGYQYVLLDRAEGKVLTEKRYDLISKMYSNNNYLTFKENGKYGLMNIKGKVVIPASYSFVGASEQYGVDKVFRVNQFGEVIEGDYGTEVNGGKWGLINDKGDSLLGIRYQQLEFTNDSLVILKDYDGFFHLFNIRSNQFVLSGNYQYIKSNSYDLLYFLVGKDVKMNEEYNEPEEGTFGIADANGKLLIPIKYRTILSYSRASICQHLDLSGFDLIDDKGQEILTKQKSIIRLNDTLFVVENDGQSMLFNILTKKSILREPVAQFNVPDYIPYNEFLLAYRSKAGSWGYMNVKGEVLIQAQYCDALTTADAYLVVAKCSDSGANAFQYGVIDWQNNVVLPCIYDAITVDYNGLFICEKDGNVFRMNASNEQVGKKGKKGYQ